VAWEGGGEGPVHLHVCDAAQSAEDRALLERLELAVERTGDSDLGIVVAALELLRKEIRESTRCVCALPRGPALQDPAPPPPHHHHHCSSMTGVPKPFKFLAPHYDTLKKRYEALPPGTPAK
jgi:hypothetical protein